MKRKFSLNELLHRDRAMMGFSLILAVVIWALVSFGPGNVETRTVTATVKVDLTGTSAGYNDLRVIGQDTFDVKVEVEGTRAVIFNLDSDDFNINPSLTDILGPGKSEVSLNVSGKETGYTIRSVSPASVTVTCDYWMSTSFTVTPDVKKLAVKDEKAQQLGDILLDSAALPDGRVQVEGPQSVIQQIQSVVARVDETHVLDKTTRFEAQLVALDAKGLDVDITDCRFTDLQGDTVMMTVPVWVQRKVDLTYALENVPSGLSQNGLVTLSHNTITLVGEEDVLAAAAPTIGNLGTFDFDHIRPDEAEFTVTLAVPSSVTVIEGNTVTVSLAIDKYTTRTLSRTVNGIDDVTVVNPPEGKTVALSQGQKLSDIVLCGNAATLRRITANDLQLTLDASSSTGSGTVRYTVRIDIPRYPNVWVYYGKDETAGYKLHGTLE